MQAVYKTHCIKDNLNVGQEESWQVSKSKHRMILCLIAHGCNSFVASLLGRGNFRTLLKYYYNFFSNICLSLTLYLHYDFLVLPVWCFSLISVEIGVACFSLYCAMPNKLELAVCFHKAGSSFCWSLAVVSWPSSFWFPCGWAELQGSEVCPVPLMLWHFT